MIVLAATKRRELEKEIDERIADVLVPDAFETKPREVQQPQEEKVIDEDSGYDPMDSGTFYPRSSMNEGWETIELHPVSSPRLQVEHWEAMVWMDKDGKTYRLPPELAPRHLTDRMKIQIKRGSK